MKLLLSVICFSGYDSFANIFTFNNLEIVHDTLNTIYTVLEIMALTQLV